MRKGNKETFQKNSMALSETIPVLADNGGFISVSRIDLLAKHWTPLSMDLILEVAVESY